MNTLIELDNIYLKSFNKIFEKLQESYINIENNYHFDLNKTEVTEAIIQRLKVYYLTQGKIKDFLNKRYLAAASDYFVETILFFLKLYLKELGNNLEVHSERQIRKNKNSIRPDISIWNGDEVVAIIECKTQLGWNRDNWEQQYLDRHIKLQTEFPNAKSLLLVMTGVNWGGFGNHIDLRQNYFCLLKNTWPVDFTTSDQIMTPIEDMFKLLK
ncbi:hypothetical protein H9N25_16785 [Pedobacter riviphilus]|uniref:Uncharacterized protein n=1 Tax=Pedobacter riviphilus TaxID=2766984 RepID=A0ABX6TDM4_9SPHI|nr:hypothetical protein [Pedobacter riviphilus]QNR83594.1 hypothetical protein H9N25_16785 [Pedobacter riviphilus]